MPALTLPLGLCRVRVSHVVDRSDCILGSLPTGYSTSPALVPHPHELEVPRAIDKDHYQIPAYKSNNESNKNPAESPDQFKTAETGKHQQEHAHNVKAYLVADVLVADPIALPLPFMQHITQHKEACQHQQEDSEDVVHHRIYHEDDDDRE